MAEYTPAKLYDDDVRKIEAKVDNEVVRTWFYDEFSRSAQMHKAHEFVEGYLVGWHTRNGDESPQVDMDHLIGVARTWVAASQPENWDGHIIGVTVTFSDNHNNYHQIAFDGQADDPLNEPDEPASGGYPAGKSMGELVHEAMEAQKLKR